MLIKYCSISSHWKVEKHLKRFVDDPKRFRSQHGAHNALVSGSLALQLHPSLFVSPVLRGKYTCNPKASYWFQPGQRLEKQARLEMRKIEPSNRPSWYKSVLETHEPLYSRVDEISKLGLPESWKYYAAKIPAWYRFQEDNKESTYLLRAW
jgi:hypothetical protein